MAGRIFDVDDPNDNSTPGNGGCVVKSTPGVGHGTPGYSGQVSTPDYGGQVDMKNPKCKPTLGSRRRNILTRVDSTPESGGQFENGSPGYSGQVEDSTPENGGRVEKKKGKAKLTLGSRRPTVPSPPLVLPPCKYILLNLTILQHFCKI